jgi:ribosomal protein L7/L12
MLSGVSHRPHLSSLRSHRLAFARYVLVVLCAGVLAVGRAIDGEWWWFALTTLVAAWAVVALVFLVRRRRDAVAVGQSTQETAAAEAVAEAQWTTERLRELARDRDLDLNSSQGRIALIKVVREHDPRLGLVAAKNAVDRVPRM